MEIRLAKSYGYSPQEGVKIEFLDEITIDRFHEFENAISKIEELHSVRRLRDLAVINDAEIHDMLNSTLHDLISKSVVWNGVKREDMDKLFLSINRLYLNYLSSIRTFIDHSETFLHRKFGEKSVEFLEFKGMLSAFYDNSFAYRFFYKLRNYSQHCGLPIDGVRFSPEYDRISNFVTGSIVINFQRDKLLSNFSKWGEKVKNDLQIMNEEFDLLPLLFEMTHNINEIERNIEQLHKEDLLKAAHFILDFTKHLRNNDGEVFIAYDVEVNNDGKLVGNNSLHIPFDTIDFIVKEF
jgi:hypothetical protein